MSTCEGCGVLLVQPDGRRLNHQAGVGLCRVYAWDRVVRERDLVRLDAELSIELLSRGVEVSYGPVVIRSDHDVFLAAISARVPSKPVPTTIATSHFAPRWAVYLVKVGQSKTLGFAGKLTRAFERAQKDPEWAAAICTIGVLAENDAAIRAAVAKFITEGT